MKLKDIIGSMAAKFAALALALVCAGNVWGANVAKIGVIEYATLAKAVAAVPTDGTATTIVMLSDVNLSAYVTIAATKNVTLDLNGKAITTGTDDSSGDHYYAINNKGKMVLKDSVGTGSISARGVYNATTSATMTIESGTYTALDTSGAAIFNKGKLVVNGGTFNGKTCMCNSGSDAKMTVNGATVNGANDYAIKNVGGNLTINDATVNSVYGSFKQQDGGATTINGGTFAFTGVEGSTTYDAYVTGGSLTIAGGSFLKTGNLDLTDEGSCILRVDSPAAATVKGGEFASAAGTAAGLFSGAISVKGGSFEIENGTAADVAGYAAAGYAIVNFSGNTSLYRVFMDNWERPDYADLSWYTANPSASTFEISSAAQFAGLAQLVNGKALNVDGTPCGTSGGVTFSKKTITLTADIDLSAHGWVPIGYDFYTQDANVDYATKSFYGTLDGGGHTIKLVLSEQNSIYDDDALFGSVRGGTLKNIVLDATISYPGEISAGYWNPDICGAACGLAASVAGGVVSNVTMNGSVVMGSRGASGAGLVGYAYYGPKFYDCVNNTSVTIKPYYTKKASSFVIWGGIVGQITGDGSDPVPAALFTRCVNNATVVMGNPYNNDRMLGGSDNGYGSMNRLSSAGETEFYSCRLHAGGIVGQLANAGYGYLVQLVDCEDNGSIVGGHAEIFDSEGRYSSLYQKGSFYGKVYEGGSSTPVDYSIDTSDAKNKVFYTYDNTYIFNAEEVDLSSCTYHGEGSYYRPSTSSSGKIVQKVGDAEVEVADADTIASLNNCARLVGPVIKQNSRVVFQTIPNYIAQIGTTKYETLAEALSNAQNSETVVLIADAVLPSQFIFNAEKEITLDLAGHAITSTADDLLRVESGALTVNDSVGGGSVFTDNWTVFCVAGGEVVVNGGKFSATQHNTVYVSEGRITFNGGMVDMGVSSVGEYSGEGVQAYEGLGENAGYTIFAEPLVSDIDPQIYETTAVGVSSTVKLDAYYGLGATLTWSSSDTSIATVDSTGLVTFSGAAGSATIYAVAQNGSYATAMVAVGTATVKNMTTGNEYVMLQTAIDAASAGDTLKLIANVSLTDAAYVPDDAEVTIDLGGFDIVNTRTGVAAAQYAIYNDGTLTIKDSQDDGTTGGHVYTTNIATSGNEAVINYGTLVIEGGWFGDSDCDKTNASVINAGRAVASFGSGSATLNGGHYTAIDNFTNEKYSYVLYVNGAEASLIVNSADIYGAMNGVISSYNGGRLVVNDANIVFGRTDYDRYSYRLAYGYYGNIVINGGTWKTQAKARPDDSQEFCDWYKSDAITITGGKFDLQDWTDVYGIAKISGGIFNKVVPAKNLAIGCICTDNLDPETKVTYPYTVGTPVAQIGDVKYVTFADAIVAAEALDPEPAIIVLDTTADEPEGWKFVTDTTVEPNVTTLVRVSYYDVWVGGTRISEDDAADVFGDGKVSYNNDTKTLTLNGYTYSGAGYENSAIYASDDISVVVQGENSLTSTAGYGIYAGGTISVTGTGVDSTLNVTAKSDSYAMQVAGESAAFTNVTMAISGNRGVVVNQNNAFDAIDVKGCTITFASGMDRAFQTWNGEGDSLLTVADSTVTGVGRILMFAEGDTGDTTCFITNSTVTLTDSQIESYNGDATVEISESTVSMTGGANNKNGAFNVGARYGADTTASVKILNNSNVTCSGQYSGINVWTWGENGPQAAEVIVEESTLTSSGSYYGLSAYSIYEGDTSVCFTDSTVNLTGGISGVEMCSDSSYNAVGDKTYTQIDSCVTLTTTQYAYGLDIDNSTKSSVNGDASTTATIIGGSLTCNGCGILVTGDDDTNSGVTMVDAEVAIDVTGRNWYPIATGELSIESGRYTIIDPAAKGIIADVGNITGGIFSEDVSDLCAAGYVCTENTDAETSEDYPYAVVPAVASITIDDETTYYTTFQDAIDDAELSDEEITITAVNYNAETMVAPEGWKFVTENDVTTLVKKVYVAQIVGGAKFESLADAIADAQAGDTVKLLADIDLGSGYVAIDKALTLDGDFTVTSSAVQAVLLTGSGDVTIKCDVTATAGHGIQAGTESAAYSGKLTVDGSTVTVAKRGIRVYKEDTGFGIVVNDSTIQSNEADPTTIYTIGDDAMALSLGTTDGKGYSVELNNTVLQGFSYCINSVMSGSNLTVVMNGGKTYGRAALNVWGSNNTFTLDGVEVHGLNNQTGPTEAFACIVENKGATNNTYNINGCTFNAELSSAAASASGSSATEQMIDLRGTKATVKITGATTYAAKVGGETVAPTDAGYDRFGLIASPASVATYTENSIDLDQTAATSLAGVLNALPEDVDQEESEVFTNGTSLGYTPEVLYYWATQSGYQGGYYSFNEPFDEGWLADGEFIALQKNVALTKDLSTDKSFTLLLGEYTLSPGEYSITLADGATVTSDRSGIGDLFSAPSQNHEIRETATEDGKFAYTFVIPEYQVTFSQIEDADVGVSAMPENFSFAKGSGEIALQKPTYISSSKTFAGWKVKDIDPEVILSAIPAGATTDYELVATWTAVRTIQVDTSTTEVQVLKDIKVTDEWIADNVEGATVETAGEVDTNTVKNELEKKDTNGLAKWQNYVLGQNPTTAVGVGAEQGETTVMPVSNTLAAQPVDTGFTVEYSLKQVETNGNVVATVETKQTTDFDIDLSTVKSNAYYTMTATIKTTSGDTVSTVTATNVIGVLAVTNAPKTSIVAVPWKGTDGENISVSNLVRTATLTPGDTLKAYDSTSRKYRTWTLDENKTWVADTVVGGAAQTAADDQKINRGEGVWLTRQDASQPIYLVGGATANEAVQETPLEKAESEEKPAWNIVASPSVEPADAAELLGENTADMIVIPTDGAPKTYYYNEAKGGWGYNSTKIVYKNGVAVGVATTFKKTDTKVPAGTGFWYLNSRTDEGAKITW